MNAPSGERFTFSTGTPAKLEMGSLITLGSVIHKDKETSGNYSVAADDHIILVQGTHTVTLPAVAAASQGRELIIINEHGDSCGVEPASSGELYISGSDAGASASISGNQSLKIIQGKNAWYSI